MLRTVVRTALASLLLLWPVIASAEAPATVTEVTAAYTDGKISVAWQIPVEGSADIVRYRIYYSHTSILENDGMYDDFVTTEMPTTSFDILELPPFPTVYVSVLAVNSAGEESASFGDEAVVELPAPLAVSSSSSSEFSAPSSSSSSLATIPPPASSSSSAPTEVSSVAGLTGSPLQLLGASGLTDTGILLTFSQPVMVAQETAADAFRVLDASGTVLTIRTIVVQGPYVTLTTLPQQLGMRYTVAALAVTSMPLYVGQLPLAMDPRTNVANFVAGAAVQTGNTTVPFYAMATNVTLGPIRLRSQATRDGTHTVFADFDVSGATSLLPSIEVLQSVDSGITFTQPQKLPADARAVRFDSVPSGTFTVLLRARTLDGQMTQSQPASIQLVSGTSSGSGLSDSGPELFAVLAMAGAAMGWRKMRRRK